MQVKQIGQIISWGGGSVNSKDTIYNLWLALRLGVASDEFLPIYNYFGDVFEIYQAEEDIYSKIDGLSETTISKLCDKSLDAARKYLYYCNNYHIKTVYYGDDDYPAHLKDIQNPPVLLYYIGELPDFEDKLSVSIVGTRKMSEYGKQTAYRISYELAAADLIIVSGMALGIDGVASCGALEGGGKVVAVLGSGIDVIYPKEHKRLMEIIMNQGAVISEYPPGSAPEAKNFPVRNRIISGLTDGTMVVEGDSHSGSLITARHALAQGKALFALPGSIDEENASGTNALLRAGANIVLDSDDVINYFRGVSFDGKIPINEVLLRKAKLFKTDCDAALAKMKICSRIYGRNYRDYISGNTGSRLENEQKRSLLSTPVAKSKKNENSEKTEIPKEKFSSTVKTARSEKPQKKAAGNLRGENDLRNNRPPESADSSGEIYASLDEKYKKVFDAIPINDYVNVDKLSAATGMNMSDVLIAVTMLELKGLIDIHPGGQYGRK